MASTRPALRETFRGECARDTLTACVPWAIRVGCRQAWPVTSAKSSWDARSLACSPCLVLKRTVCFVHVHDVCPLTAEHCSKGTLPRVRICQQQLNRDGQERFWTTCCKNRQPVQASAGGIRWFVPASMGNACPCHQLAATATHKSSCSFCEGPDVVQQATKLHEGAET